MRFKAVTVPECSDSFSGDSVNFKLCLPDRRTVLLGDNCVHLFTLGEKLRSS
jgi:hypothetical protein